MPLVGINLPFCRRVLCACLLIAAGIQTGPLRAAPQFALTDLGRLPHIADDIAPGLSANGSVSAWAAKPGSGFNASYWSSLTAAPAALSLPDRDLFAADVSPSGLVVGLAKDPRDLRFTQAFSWHHGTMTMLPTLGGTYASARAVSPAGWIVGSADLAGGLHHACLWRNGAASDLGTLPGGDFSIAAGLNAQGVIVGVSDITPNGKSHAVLWRGGRIQDLGLLPGGSLSAARAVNAHGEAVGWGDIYGGIIHAVLWRGGRPIDIGTLGDDPGAAWSINNAGQIVGSSAVSPGKMRAFFWQSGLMCDLNDLVPSHSGWVLETAYRITSRGWILGMGRLRGEAHLFLLRPVRAGKKTARSGAANARPTGLSSARPMGLSNARS